MFRFRRRKDPEKNYINKAIIGLGVGLVRSKDLLLSPDFGPQGAMDILSVWIGQELVKEMLSQKKISPQDDEQVVVDKLLNEVQIAEDLSINYKGDEINVSIQNCLICPKREQLKIRLKLRLNRGASITKTLRWKSMAAIIIGPYCR